MEPERNCPSCGKHLPPHAPQGLCPECLMQAGFPTGAAPHPGDPTSRRSFSPPSVESVAGLFPQLEVLELLGHGGMGAVYKARQPALDRFVALKILPPHPASDTGFAERFTREARALARLNHPNIVAVHEFGLAAQYHFFVMEYVEGGNLRELQQAGRFSPREALKIVPQICEALQYAHDEGVVHRDIKPENVMLDRKGRVKITDFGLAKIAGIDPEKLRLTGARDVMGTPHYMAPEQIERPQEVDHRADIYSLGVVFYELLTGELPIGRFAAPSKKVQVDVRLDEVVLQSLEKDPARRYQHASEVKTDVESIANGSTARGEPGRAVLQRRLERAAEACRWIARIASVLLLMFYGAALVIEGMPPVPSQPAGVQLNFLALGLMVAGFIVGWRKEGTAAVLIACGVVLWNVAENSPRWNLFQTPLPVAALYAFYWWVRRGRQTSKLAAVAGGLVLVFLLGRLFVPSSVFIRGTIRDAYTGLSIGSAELSLKDTPSAQKVQLAGARTSNDGRFNLYVGWFRDGMPLVVTAPGYLPLETNLPPRKMGQRNIAQNFLLTRDQRAGNRNAIPDAGSIPVVIHTVPESGAADVDPRIRELRVSFSTGMATNSWSWVRLDEESFPETTGEARFAQDDRTCILPVRLRPGSTYALWINVDEFENFRSKAGVPSIPYLLIFKTKD